MAICSHRGQLRPLPGEGMTAEDMIQGSRRPTERRPARRRDPYHSNYGEVAAVIARWEDQSTPIILSAPAIDPASPGALLEKLDALRRRHCSGRRLEAQEAPSGKSKGRKSVPTTKA